MIPSVGFDFDLCLANAYSITPFVILLETLIPKALSRQPALKNEMVFLQKSRLIFYQAVAQNEILTKGTIFRPSMLRILPKLLELKSQGNIRHLYIYSNNSLAEIIHVLDYILALTLEKAPYNVPTGHLIKDSDGFLHTLTPRIHLDAACRNVETKDSNNFREKSLEGINACLGDSVADSEMWFFDDTRYHTRLMNQLKEKYMVVEPYNVQLSNKKIASLFIESYPVDAFKPNTRIGSIVLTEINRLLPGFRPTGYETRERLIEKMVKVLNTFSPESGGKVFARWKDDHINKDYGIIEKGLSGVLNKVEPTYKETNRPLSYDNPIGIGGSVKGGALKKHSKKSNRWATRKLSRRTHDWKN